MSKGKKSKFSLLVLMVFLVYFICVFINQQKLIYAKNLEMQKVQQKIQEESKLNEELKKQKEDVDSDEYVEKVAREKLGMVKDGEKVFYDVNR